MKIDFTKWKEFDLSSILTILNGKGITKEEISENPGCVEAVQSGEENNGILGYIDKQYCIDQCYTFTEKPCLTVARSGSAGYVSYHPYGCVVGDSAKILLLDESIASTNVYLFMQTILTANRFKYAYGRKVTKDKYGREVLMLPVCHSNGKPVLDAEHKYSPLGYIPDWSSMEDMVNSLPHKPIKTKNRINKSYALKTVEWKRFRLDRLFSIEKGKRLTKEDQEPGHNIYIGAIDSNNGVANHIGQSPIHKGNTISLSYNGSVGEAFYQPDPYWATDDVNALYPRFAPFNVWIGLFISAVIRKEQYRFSYGRKWTLENMNETEICLPVKHNIQGVPVIEKECKFSDAGYVPDFAAMESFVKSLPLGDKLS